MYRLLLVLLVSLLYSRFSNAQTPFCDIDSITPDPANLPMPALADSGLYSALIEKNADKSTSEYQEFYDGVDNVGVIRVTTRGEVTSYHYYYKLNRLLVVHKNDCSAFALNSSAPEVNIGFQVVNLDGQELIMTPLNAIINSPGFQIKYVGKFKTDRGIAVNRWVACVKSKDDKISSKLTISFTDPVRYIPPYHDTVLSGSPAEFIVESKHENSAEILREIYEITNFRTFSPRTEEFYLTKSGVYCEGRDSQGREFPHFPYSFVYYTQATIGDSADGMLDSGIVESLAIEYNSEFHLYGRTYQFLDSVIFELRDYQTGLTYDVTLSTSECRITNLLPDDYFSQQNITFLMINDPNQFFNTTGMTYQYVGTKLLEGLVDTDVWIGKGKINKINVIVEWYFLSKSWGRFDEEIPDKLIQKPVMLKAFFPDEKELVFIYSFYGFKQTGYNIAGFDIKSCHPDTARKFFVFSLHADLIPVVKTNEQGFKEAVVKLIQEKARVSILRVSRVEVAYDTEGVYVFFTLYDRVKAYGPLATVSYELDNPLNDAVKFLNTAFLLDQIQIFFFSYTENTDFVIPVVTDSLREVENYEEGFVMIKKEKTKPGVSGGVVALCTIIIGVMGLTVGYFLIVLHTAKRINIPYINKLFSM